MNSSSLRFSVLRSALALASIVALPTSVSAATVANPLCPNNTALFNPGTGQDIVVPPGFKVSVFASGLNMPTGIAFLGNAKHFQVYVLESVMGCRAPKVAGRQPTNFSTWARVNFPVYASA